MSHMTDTVAHYISCWAALRPVVVLAGGSEMLTSWGQLSDSRLCPTVSHRVRDTVLGPAGAIRVRVPPGGCVPKGHPRTGHGRPGPRMAGRRCLLAGDRVPPGGVESLQLCVSVDPRSVHPSPVRTFRQSPSGVAR